MNADMVTSNECKNDGSYLHLYFLDSASTWIAYGLSAFGLRLFVKSEGCMSLRGFSKKLQMPCTQVGEDTVPLLLQRAIVVRHISASYLLVRMPDAVDRSAYARWTDKLRGGEHPKFDEDIEISTPVSRYVPKDRFIPDGMSSFSRQVKRIGDCILAFVALIVFSPLFLICYIAVKQEDGGPAIFKQWGVSCVRTIWTNCRNYGMSSAATWPSSAPGPNGSSISTRFSNTTCVMSIYTRFVRA